MKMVKILVLNFSIKSLINISMNIFLAAIFQFKLFYKFSEKIIFDNGLYQNFLSNFHQISDKTNENIKISTIRKNLKKYLFVI